MENKKKEKDILKINEDFAKKFEHNARRKEIEILESKYGKEPGNENDA